jgi:hypothetical protein
MTQIEKHKKAVRILLAIEKLEILISQQEKHLADFEQQKNMFKVKEHIKLRIAIETDKKIRLKNYYERCFKL